MSELINFHQCRACGLKHLASALTLSREIAGGYDTIEYHLYLLGNLAEAQEQLTRLEPKVAARIRELRLKLFGDRAHAQIDTAALRELEDLVYRFAASLPVAEWPEHPVATPPVAPRSTNTSPSPTPCRCRKAAPPESAPAVAFRRPDGTPAGLENRHLGADRSGAGLFLVFSGPSVKQLDPAPLRRPGICVLSVNNAPATLLAAGVTPQYWIAVDAPSNFLPEIFRNPAITKLIPEGALQRPLWDNQTGRRLAATPADLAGVFSFRFRPRFQAASFFREPLIQWGDPVSEGGIRTVFLAALQAAWLLGFRRLYLLGADFRMDPAQPYHFPERRTPRSIEHNNRIYRLLNERYLPALRAVQPPELTIFNCTEPSELCGFPRLPFEQAVAREAIDCTALATTGMYRSLKEKERKDDVQPEH